MDLRGEERVGVYCACGVRGMEESQCAMEGEKLWGDSGRTSRGYCVEEEVVRRCPVYARQILVNTMNVRTPLQRS